MAACCINPKSINPKIGGESGEINEHTIYILHQIVARSHLYQTELEVWLNTELNQVNVICLTEHWLKCQNLISTNIQNFKLVSAFNRKCKTHGGSCIYIKDNILTKDIDCLATFGEEINFELSLIELVDFKLYIGCIYRAPDGQFDIFLHKLETIIQKLLRRNKVLILERPVTTEREAWNERERERARARESERERENGWIAQENEIPLSKLPNYVRPYWKLVAIYSRLHGLQCKFC